MDTKERISFLRRKNIKPGYLIKISGDSYNVICVVNRSMTLKLLYTYSDTDGYNYSGAYSEINVNKLEKFPYEVIKNKDEVAAIWAQINK